MQSVQLRKVAKNAVITIPVSILRMLDVDFGDRVFFKRITPNSMCLIWWNAKTARPVSKKGRKNGAV